MKKIGLVVLAILMMGAVNLTGCLVAPGETPAIPLAEKTIKKLFELEKASGLIEKGIATLLIGEKPYSVSYSIRLGQSLDSPEYYYSINFRDSKWEIFIIDRHNDKKADSISVADNDVLEYNFQLISAHNDSFPFRCFGFITVKTQLDGKIPVTLGAIEALNDFDWDNSDFYQLGDRIEITKKLNSRTAKKLIKMADLLIWQLQPVGEDTSKDTPSVTPKPIPSVNKEILARERYGKYIIYYHFSEISDNLTSNQQIELPKDLKKYLSDKWNNPKIENCTRFEEEVWQEAAKLGYSPEKLKTPSVKDAIMAAVEIVGSRLTYYDVDIDMEFIKEHGEFLPNDVYFHLGLGDCDKYRDAIIAVFALIKELNPGLQNVYLSNEELGGNFCRHAWVSVLILQEDCLILSHIDPTFYDNDGSLEAEDGFHITLKHNIFLTKFYDKLVNYSDFEDRYDNCLFVYQIFYDKLPGIEEEEIREDVLTEMGSVAGDLSIYGKNKSREYLDKIIWVLEQYEAEGFVQNLPRLLDYARENCLKDGNEDLAEYYKQRLINEFPDSYYTRCLMDDN